MSKGFVKTYARDVVFWEQEGINAVLSDQWGSLTGRTAIAEDVRTTP